MWNLDNSVKVVNDKVNDRRHTHPLTPLPSYMIFFLANYLNPLRLRLRTTPEDYKTEIHLLVWQNRNNSDQKTLVNFLNEAQMKVHNIKWTVQTFINFHKFDIFTFTTSEKNYLNVECSLNLRVCWVAITF